MSVYRLLTAIPIVLLAACNDTSPQPPSELSYRTAPDGSRFAVEERMSMTNSVRCWENANRFDCLRIRELFADGMSSVTISAASVDSIPVALSDFPMSIGYECSYFSGGSTTERISSRDGILIENFGTYDFEPWPKSYVNNLLKDNAIIGQQHFKCVEIAELLQNGGEATFGSTLISHGMITG